MAYINNIRKTNVEMTDGGGQQSGALVNQTASGIAQQALTGATAAAGTAEKAASTMTKTSSKSAAAPAATNPYATQMANAQSRLNTAMPTYTDSYADRIAALEQSGPGEYTSKYRAQIDSAMEALQNRKAYQYNMSEDPVYRQYAAMYAQQGKRAMQDTMGKAAALSGGYGSSYASTAGNQAYQQHLGQLNDKAMELAALNRQNYDREGDEMRANLSALQAAENQARQTYENDRNAWYNQLAMLQQGQATEYQQYRDAVSDYQNDQQNAWNQYKYWNDKWAKLQ